MQWALLPTLVFNAARGVFAALGRTRPTLVATLIAVAFNALSNYAIGLGHFGFPRLGVLGSGLSTTFSQLVMIGALLLYARLDPRLHAARLFSPPWAFDRKALAEIWRLGAPIGFSIAVEIGVFAAAALAMGLISQEAVEAHAIVMQIAATAFMVPLGLGQAASVRVGHAFGARDAERVASAGWAAFTVILVFVTLSASLMFAFPHHLIAPFLGGDEAERAGIVALALSFLRVAAFFQIFDGAQAALINMLRGVHDSRVPALLATLGYWVIGAPISFVLGFLTPLKGLGLWIGLAIGLAAVSALLLQRWLARQRRGFF
jgi:multidrug resistance protein, MATE family